MKQNILFLVFCLNLFPLNGQVAELVLNSSYSGTHDKVARDAVIMNPGFSYTPSAGNTFIARTQPDLIIPAIYYTGNPYSTPVYILNESLPPGYSTGQPGVNNLGAATYEIPITIPGGTGGLTPSLSIIYNSLAGNGILGPGFFLSGLSEISRINLPFYAQEESPDMLLNSEKQFALDGNRLVLISGSHAQNGAVYKTENETFTHITFYGTFGSGSEWFKVETKDGKTIEYGRTAYSKIKPLTSNYSKSYCINKISDQFGNYLIFNYSQLPTNGETFLANIQYTGNSNTSLTPYNKIEFLYEQREDIEVNFFKGLKTYRSLILREIKSTVENATYKSYRFKYYKDNYSYLMSVSEFSDSDELVNVSNIRRPAGPEVPYTIEYGGMADLDDRLLYPGDFNSDGLTDLMTIPDKSTWLPTDEWKLFLNIEGELTEVSSNQVGNHFKGISICDINGDGNDDIFFEYYETVTYECNCRPCDELLAQSSQLASPMVAKIIIPPPVPDTCCDLCSYSQNSFLAHRLLDNDLAFSGIRYDFYNPPSNLDMRTADLDGNGLVDYLFLDQNRNVIGIRGVAINSLPAFSNPTYLFVGDFNGNGTDDILTLNGSVGSSGTVHIWEYDISQNIFVHRGYSSLSLVIPEIALPGDFNGDGIMDLLVGKKGYCSSVPCFDTQILFLAGSSFAFMEGPNPTGFSYPEQSNLILDESRWLVEMLPADFNLDGKTDILVKNQHYFMDRFTHEPYPYPNYLNEIYLFTGKQYSSAIPIMAHELDFTKVIDNNNDGTPDIYFVIDNYEDYSVSFLKNDARNYVSEITNSSNISSKFTYDLPATNTFYTFQPEEFSFPVQHLVIPIRLVSRLEVIDRNLSEHFSDISYFYSNFKFHRQGKGLLGFSSVTSVDAVSGDSVINHITYHPTFYYPYTWKSDVFKYSIPVSEKVNEFTFLSADNGRRFFPYPSREIFENKIDNISRESNYLYDSDGNITNRSTEHLNSSLQTVKSITESMSGYNSYGSPGHVTIISTNNASTITRERSFNYFSNGLVQSVTASFGTSQPVVSSYTYDAFGNNLTETIVHQANTGTITRTRAYTYEQTKARFAKSETNQFGQTTEYQYDPLTLLLIEETDFNNLATSYKYDNIGRLTKKTNPDSTSHTITRGWSTEIPDIKELFYEQTSSTGKPLMVRYYNSKGREVRSMIKSFDGRFIVNDTEYDNQGRVTIKYNPYFQGDDRNQAMTTFYYNDQVGRLSDESIVPNNILISYDYSPLITTINKAGRTYETELNAAGQKIRISEPGGNIYYHYNAEDRIISIGSPSGSTTIEYDDYGNQSKLIDVDAGTILYKYNGLGELEEQTDFKGNDVVYSYDAAGRIIAEDWNSGFIKSYEYNPQNQQISRIYTSEGSQIAYNYDNLSRVTTITHEPDQQNTFIKSYTYNSEGKVEKVVTNNVLTELYYYNINGSLERVIVNDSIIWQAYSQNKNGSIDNFKLRNNRENTVLSFDQYGFCNGIVTTSGAATLQNWIYNFNPVTGNMASRRGLGSLGNLLEETFPEYDSQDRLKEYRVGTNISNIEYDAGGMGNIISKSDVGGFNYESTVHALTSVSDPTSLMTSLPEQTITYTPFNKISTLVQTDESNDVKQLTWAYSPAYERDKQVFTINGQVQSVKYYAFGDFEKVITPTKTSEIYYINTPSGTVAAIEVTPAQTTYYYIHTDLLGSFDVITNHNGVIAEKNCFDPWGRRRNFFDWRYNNVSSTLLLGRGFTGHEHLLEFGLINMNGRVYDPLIGMFISPDNYVQAPERVQNFNRYTYCLNNPLVYADPDGEWFITLMFMLGNAYLNGFLANDFELNPVKWDWENPNTYLAVGSGLYSGHQFGLQVEKKYLQEHLPMSVAEEISFNYEHSSTSYDLLGDYSTEAENILRYQLGDEMFAEAKTKYGQIITGYSAPRGYVFNTENGYYEQIRIERLSGFLGRRKTYSFTRVNGIFSDGDIYVSSARFANRIDATTSLLHELGHAYQYSRNPSLYNRYKGSAEFGTWRYILVTLKRDPSLFDSWITNPKGTPIQDGYYMEIFDLLKYGFPINLK